MATCEFEGSFHEAYTPRKQCSRSSPPVFMDNQTDAGYGRFCPVPPTFETIIDGKKVELQHPRPLTPPPCIRSCRTVKGEIPSNSRITVLDKEHSSIAPAIRRNLPNFGPVYRAYEKRHKNETQPQLPPSCRSIWERSPQRPNENAGPGSKSEIMTHAARLFIRAWSTAATDRFKAAATKGWYVEAEALSKEIERALSSRREGPSVWPDLERQRAGSSDSGFKSDRDGNEHPADDPESTLIVIAEEPVRFAPAVANDQNKEDHLPPLADIHRDLLDLDPFAFIRSSSPASKRSRASSQSNDDFDQDSVTSSTNSRATKTSSSAESKGYSPDQSSGFSTTFTTPGSSPEKTPPATRDDTGCFFMPRHPPPCGIQTLMPPPKWLQKRPSNTRSPGLPFPTPPDSAPPHRNVSCQRSTPMMATLRGGRMTSSDSDRSDFSQQKHKDWITDDILEMIMVRDRLYKRMKKHPAPDIVGMYKKVRNMVVGMTRNAKRAYEKKLEERRVTAGYPPCFSYHQRRTSSSSYRSTSSSYRSSSSLRSSFTSGSSNSSVCAN